MSLGTRLAGRTTKTLAKYGSSLVLEQRRQGAYDPSTSTAPVVVTSVTVMGLASPVDSARGDMQEEADVVTSRRRVVLDAAPFETAPLPGDVLTGLEGRTWTVTGVTPVTVQGLAVAYSLLVKS